MSIFEDNKPTIKEWARRIEAGETVEDIQRFSNNFNLWQDGEAFYAPTWTNTIYRFPPKTITVNDVECEANFIPEINKVYYFHNGRNIFGDINEGRLCDEKTISTVPVFRTKEAAEAYHTEIHKPFMLGGESES